MGLLWDAVSGRRRVCWALIFTAVFSRHQFVWLTFRQTTEAVIEGCEAAWAFFGGVFGVLIPDNMEAIVDKADALEPRLNKAFVEYAQARGFVIDPARVRKPTDKPRVERVVPFTRGSMFAGETFIDIDDAQRHAEAWCRTRAGMRTHGTTQCRPAELFALEEQPHLLAAPAAPYDLPLYAKPKVHRDHHVEVAKALYSVPGNLIGAHVDARADRQLVRIFHRGQLIKVHARKPPGGRSTDPADLPADKTTYALRDIEHLRRMAATHGEAIGTYAAALLDSPAPVDEDAPGLCAPRAREAVGVATRRGGVHPRPRRRSDQRATDRANDRAGHRERRACAARAEAHRAAGTVRSRPQPLRHHQSATRQ
jgi:Mu transposase, C-terminal domain